MIKNKVVIFILSLVFRAIMDAPFTEENYRLAGWILGNTPPDPDERK